MKILAVSGSPRRDGNSDVAARTVLATLRDLGETEFIRVAHYAIRHCIGCGRCWRLQQCVIQDDQFGALVAKWKEADLLIFSDPVYWLNPPGIMKDVIDRTFSLVNQPTLPLEKTRVALITVAAENGFELHNELLSRWLKTQGAQLIGSIDIHAWGKEDLAHDRPQQQRLEAFAAELRRIMTSRVTVA
jgi:multimeric flavodoxin WrbA